MHLQVYQLHPRGHSNATISQVPLSQSALLLVVDAQDRRGPPKWERRTTAKLRAQRRAVIDAYLRRPGFPCFFFLHTDGDPGFERDSPHLRLMDLIRANPGEPVLLKDTRNAFMSTTLQAQLLALGDKVPRDHRDPDGAALEMTPRRRRSRLRRGFRDRRDHDVPDPNWDIPGEELGVEAVEERTVYALRKRFARIVKTAALVAGSRARDVRPEPAFPT